MRSLVVLVALLARLAPLALLPPYPLQDDTRMYVGIATNVLDGWGFSYDFNGDGVPEVTNEEPGYPLVLAGLVAIAGDHALTLARWIQIVFGAVAAVLVFDLGVRLGSRRGGLVAGMAYALHPGLVLEAGVPGHEAALVPLVVLAVWLTTRYITAGSLLVAFAAGLVWGAATLVKQTVLALPLISAGVLVAAAKGNRRWMGPVAIAVAFLCAVAPWTIRALMVRFMAARMVAEVAPGVDRAAPQELRRLGRQLQEQKLRERIHPKTPETTTLARVAYEFTADPRRPLAVIVAGGGEVEALLLRPLGLVRRVLENAQDPGVLGRVFLTPYENRFVEFLAPGSVQLGVWIHRRQPLDAALGFKAVLAALMAVLHASVLVATLVLLRNPISWPLLGTVAYFYLMPLVSRAPQNRFFFPGIPPALATAGAAVPLASRYRWLRRDSRAGKLDPRAGKIVYVLPAWDARSAEHYAHAVPFLEEVGRRADLAVVVERAPSPPPLTTATLVHVLPAGWRPAARMLALAWCLVRLRRRGYARVFVRISQPAALVAGSVGRLLGMRSYYWNSGQGKNLAPPWGPGPAQAWRRLRYEAKLVPFYLATRLVHRFVTGPECMRPYFARAYGIPQRRTIVLYNDLDVDSFQRCLSTEPRSAARRKLGLPEDGPVVLFVGRVSPLKGGPYLLPLAERILKKTEDATMVIVGPVHIPEFRVQWATHPHRHRIHLVGPLSNAEIARAYACADVMVIPSNSEGFPRVLLECMAAGLPFAAFDVGGIKEIADPAHSPYIVPRGDVDALAAAVVDLLRDPQRRCELAEIGRTRVRRYHTPEVAAMFVSRIVLDGEEPARP